MNVVPETLKRAKRNRRLSPTNAIPLTLTSLSASSFILVLPLFHLLLFSFFFVDVGPFSFNRPTWLCLSNSIRFLRKKTAKKTEKKTESVVIPPSRSFHFRFKKNEMDPFHLAGRQRFFSVSHFFPLIFFSFWGTKREEPFSEILPLVAQ